MEYKDYYATLGVDKKASQDEIQKAYRKLARKHHPDVSGDAGSEEKFKEITEAYEVLKDPEKRKTYDTFGSDWKRRGGPPPGWQSAQGGGGGGGVHFDFGGDASHFSSFFESIFGGGGGGGRASRGGQGDPFSGFGGQAPGQGFGGQGFGGQGFGGGQNLDQEMTLALTLEEAAQGGRREISVHDPSTQERKTFTVNIPAGIGHGQKLRLKGKGGEGPGGRKGNLYIKIQLRPHQRFRLDGRDLHADLPVAPWLAALGGEASVKTLDGSLTLKIPAGSSSGRKIRLKGKGFPNPKGKDGDLFAEIRVMVPETLSDEEKELFEKLAEVSSFSPKA